MANIPVEKTGGAGIWPWLLALLALVLVGWLALELFDDEPDADEIVGTENNVGLIDDVELGDDDFDDGAVITTIEPLYDDYATDAYADGAVGDGMGGDGMTDGQTGGMDGAGSGDTRVGQSVDLDGARVLSVVGDSAFFVGTDENRRVLVVLETLGESEYGAEGRDGVYNVDEGETVSINGTVARYMEGARGTWDLPDADRERMLQRGLYVKVNSRADIAITDGSDMGD